MKVLLVNADLKQDDLPGYALQIVQETLHNCGVETEMLWLGESEIHVCTACNKCNKQKICIFEDAVNDIIRRQSEFDGMIAACPLYFGKVNKQMINFFERLFIAGPSAFDGKPVGIVTASRNKKGTADLRDIMKYLESDNVPLVNSMYPCIVRGEDDTLGKDAAEGLAANMAWLLQCIEAGKQAGIEKPVQKQRVRTWFLR